MCIRKWPRNTIVKYIVRGYHHCHMLCCGSLTKILAGFQCCFKDRFLGQYLIIWGIVTLAVNGAWSLGCNEARHENKITKMLDYIQFFSDSKWFHSYGNSPVTAIVSDAFLRIHSASLKRVTLDSDWKEDQRGKSKTLVLETLFWGAHCQAFFFWRTTQSTQLRLPTANSIQPFVP